MTVSYGSVVFNGIEYALQGQAEFTNRLLLDWQVEEGYDEFYAPATDSQGNEYTVYWLQQAKDVEDLSDLNWDEPSRVVAK